MSENTTFDTTILPRLFRELEDNRKSGILRVADAAEEVKIIIQNGAVLYVTGSRKDSRLGYLLCGKGVIKADQLNQLLRSAQQNKVSLGQALVDANLMSYAKLEQFIRYQARQIIYRLFCWPRGEFEFRGVQLNLKGMAVTRLSISPLIAEATRRIDDAAILAKQVPDLETIFDVDPAAALDDESYLQPDEQRIYELVDGLRTVQELIHDSGFGKNKVVRALYVLNAVGRVSPSQLKIYKDKHEGEAVSVIFKGYNQEPDEMPEPSACDKQAHTLTVDLEDTGIRAAEKPVSSPNRGRAQALKEKIIQQMGDLPPVMQTIIRSREVMKRPGTSLSDLGEVLETDQSMAAKILKMANSAYYGLSGQIGSVQHAAVVLGYETLAELISIAAAGRFLDRNLEGYGITGLSVWHHSLSVAFSARIIAIHKFPQIQNEAFTAGLLHDAGKIVLDPYLKNKQKALERVAGPTPDSYTPAAETQLFGFDHAQIGGALFEAWNFQPLLFEAVATHHDPEKSPRGALACVVNIANAIAKMQITENGVDPSTCVPDADVQSFLALSNQDLAAIGTEAAEGVMQIVESK